jgi:hypothetical protein
MRGRRGLVTKANACRCERDVVDDPGSVFQGQRMKNGWKNSGLPWTYEPDPNRM